jgi:chromosome segregation ATPase
MNNYKKENELLKKELYKNDDYMNKLGLEDYSNENKKKIDILNDEIRILNNQLEEHKKCINERNMLNNEYIELKKNLQEIKKNIKNVKNQIKEKELDKNNIANLETIEDNTTNNNLSPRGNIGNINKNSFIKPTSRNTIPYLNISNTYKSTILPVILSPHAYKYDKNILSKEFYTKLKKHYEGRENEYETLCEKITETENSRNFIENKHKNEIKQFNTQICTLDEQFKILNNEGKGTGSNIRVLKYKLNTTKNEAKHFLAQIQKLKAKLNYTINISRERDHEILLLKGQIHALKNKEIKRKEKEKEKEKERER